MLQSNLMPRRTSPSAMPMARSRSIRKLSDNFLIDRERAIGIAEGLVRRGIKFDWSIQASTNLVVRLSVDEWKLLKRAGISQVSQGADTGSPKMMHLMNKDFQDLDTIYLAAEKLTAAGVRPSFNLI